MRFIKHELMRITAPVILAVCGCILPSAARADWGTAESALTGTSVLALGGVSLAFILLRRLHRRQKQELTRSLQDAGEQSAAARALAASGIRLFHWPEEGGGGSYGATGLNEIQAELGDTEFTRVNAAVNRLHQGGVPFHMVCQNNAGQPLEIMGRGDRDGVAVEVREAADARAVSDSTGQRADLINEEASRLATVLDGLDMPVWLRDSTDALIWCNNAYASAVGTDREGATADNGIELLSGSGAIECKELAHQARTGNVRKAIKKHAVVDGERRLLELVELPAANDAGTVGWARDITDFETSKAELRRHIDAHAQVLEALSEAISIYAPDKRLIFYNSEFVKLFGLDETWLAREPLISEVIEAQREQRRLPEQANWRAYKEHLLELFTNVTEPQEDLLHLPDGSTLRQVITPHPFGGLQFMGVDVTDRLTLERSYSTLTAVQRATLDNLHEAVAVFGADGRLKLWNPGYANLWALDPDQMEDEPHILDILDLTRPLIDSESDWEDYKATEIARINERFAGGQRLERRDQRVLDAAYVPLPDGATLIAYLDITDRFQVEQALRERAEAMETADRLKSEFIANVSYELRTPLNTMIGFTEILANQYFGPLNERQQDYVHGILDSSQHLLSLINDILDLATVEAGLMVLENEPLDIHSVLFSMLGLVNERIRKNQLEVTFECDAAIGQIEADERRLKQVLYNLLSNAIKFTPAGGKITLGARRENDGIAIWVSDTGIGIAVGDQRQVFEKFSQGAGALNRQAGTGLGLSLVKNFVQLHGGRVDMVSAPDEGTTVTCFFPDTHPADAASLA